MAGEAGQEGAAGEAGQEGAAGAVWRGVAGHTSETRAGSDGQGAGRGRGRESEQKGPERA